MKTEKTVFAALAASAIVGGAFAASTVTIDGVTQRWPWNNKLDIAYTVTGGQDVSLGVYRKLVFTCVIDGVTNVIDGVSDVGASANDGSHMVTWTAPAGFKTTNCTMSAALYASDGPSGDDYMVINLSTGAIAYEGLLATQSASNDRYNTATYKTTHMVLRKVPAGGTYPTGYMNSMYCKKNYPTTWTTDRDYYVGIFPVTQRQYEIVYGSNASASTHRTDVEGNVAAHRPVTYGITWNGVRSSIAANTEIPAVESVTVNRTPFFQVLKYRTGNTLAFDLPTVVMAEIAIRAGVTTKHSWGDTADDGASYAACKTTSGGLPMAVGTFSPNAWGIYDGQGNCFELCRDDYNASLLAEDYKPWSAIDPWTPLCDTTGETTTCVALGGGDYSYELTSSLFFASYVGSRAKNSGQAGFGFRVAVVMK